MVGQVMDVGRFSGVRVYRGGQKNVLGSYPLHYHLVGNCPTCFIKDCTVERSFFRCFTLHQTHDALVTRNVAFNAWGHCYYLEEVLTFLKSVRLSKLFRECAFWPVYYRKGVEENNTLSYNLGANINCIRQEASGYGQEGASSCPTTPITLLQLLITGCSLLLGETFKSAADLLLPADTAAAAYYITNAYNTIVGNTGSGGWAVYAFPNLPGPTGLARNNTRYKSLKPQERPVLVRVDAFLFSSIRPNATQPRTLAEI
jgi:hypothetical protein